jgi:hypothetical protein
MIKVLSILVVAACVVLGIVFGLQVHQADGNNLSPEEQDLKSYQSVVERYRRASLEQLKDGVILKDCVDAVHKYASIAESRKWPASESFNYFLAKVFSATDEAGLADLLQLARYSKWFQINAVPALILAADTEGARLEALEKKGDISSSPLYVRQANHYQALFRQLADHKRLAAWDQHGAYCMLAVAMNLTTDRDIPSGNDSKEAELQRDLARGIFASHKNKEGILLVAKDGYLKNRTYFAWTGEIPYLTAARKWARVGKITHAPEWEEGIADKLAEDYVYLTDDGYAKVDERYKVIVDLYRFIGKEQKAIQLEKKAAAADQKLWERGLK